MVQKKKLISDFSIHRKFIFQFSRTNNCLLLITILIMIVSVINISHEEKNNKCLGLKLKIGP